MLRALAKSSAARFPSVKAFAEALATAFPASALASAKEVASAPGRSSPASPRPDQPVLSQTQPARPGAAAPSPASGRKTPETRLPLAPTVADKRRGGTSSSPVFSGMLATRPAPSHSVFWALVCGGSVGYFSCGFFLLLYLQAAHGFTNPLAFLLGGDTVLASLCWLLFAGWLARKRTSRLTSGWVAGSIAGPIQQISAWLLGHVALHLTLPVSFPLLLLLWSLLGGALGLLGAKRRRS